MEFSVLFNKLDFPGGSSIKGHLVSKGHFGVFKSTKKPTKIFKGFLPKPLKRGQIKKNKGTLYR